MKAKEIMTGDYFRIAQTGKIIKILAVDDNSGCVDYFDGYAGGALTIGIEKIEPIPLTAEILEKNGFVPDNFSPYYLPIKDGSVRFSKHQYGLYCNILRPYQRYDGVCNYVHNLQHALRLCGIDKEIVL